MVGEIKQLKSLVAENKIDDALDVLSRFTQQNTDIQEQIVTLSAKLKDVKKRESLGIIDSRDSNLIRAQVVYAIAGLISEVGRDIVKPKIEIDSELIVDTKTIQTVFISYNHHDSIVANRIKEELQSKGISVIVDSEKMLAGDDIKEFIHSSVRDTNITLSLVSNKSLLSAWVALESISTFYNESVKTNRKFIACYIEDDFFKPDFTDHALDSIDEQISKIRDIIRNRLDKNRSIRDLQNQLARLTDLQNNLDEIVRRLRESFCVDISDKNFDKNFYKILQVIQS